MKDLLDAEAADPRLDLTAKKLLVLTAQSAVADGIARAMEVARTAADRKHINDAKALLLQGESPMNRRHYLGAINAFQDGLKETQHLIHGHVKGHSPAWKEVRL